MSQERNGEWNACSGWCEVAIKHGFMDDLKRFCAPWFLEIGSHSADGVEFEVGVAAPPEFLGCFEGVFGVFGRVAK